MYILPSPKTKYTEYHEVFLGEVSMGGRYLPHIINCSLVVLHCTVPVTTLDTKQLELLERDSSYCPTLPCRGVLGTDVTGACEVATPPSRGDYCLGWKETEMMVEHLGA
jgi:hypothetical protein